MSEWITNRLPTKQEAVSGNVICCRWGHINLLQWYKIEAGEPWMPITKPDMYVKPKRWTVECISGMWVLCDGKTGNSQYIGICELEPTDTAKAQRICETYNEVMP
jgi:hypothetical protein